MPDDDARLAEVQDPDGREVVSLARVWEGKITRDHPELPGRLDEVLDAVTGPDHIEPDPLVGRLRYDRRQVGPSAGCWHS